TEAPSASASGLASSILTVQSATLTSGTCGAPGSGGPYTSPTTVTGTTNPAITAGFCYLYTLTGTDNVGNAASVLTTVKVTAAPTLTISTAERDGGNKKVHFTGTGAVATTTITVTICA